MKKIITLRKATHCMTLLYVYAGDTLVVSMSCNEYVYAAELI